MLKMLSLDEEVIRFLKTKDNSSGYVNQVLKERMEKEDIDSMSKEELEKLIKKYEIQEEADKKIKELG